MSLSFIALFKREWAILVRDFAAYFSGPSYLESSQLKKVQILIATVQDVLGNTLTQKLEMVGCCVALVHSADTAIEQSHFIAPDLFITDFVLAGTSGIETAIRVRDAVPDCAVLVLSEPPSRPQDVAEGVVGMVTTIPSLKHGPLLLVDVNRKACHGRSASAFEKSPNRRGIFYDVKRDRRTP